MSSGYTSAQFQVARKALLACSNADRAFLRRWLLKWTDDHGRIVKEAPELPNRAVPDK